MSKVKVGDNCRRINILREQFEGQGQDTFDKAMVFAQRIAYLLNEQYIQVTILSNSNKNKQHDNAGNELPL